MRLTRLIATKPFHYNTRRLKAGDEFDASHVHARVLVAAQRASYADEAETPRRKIKKRLRKPREKAND
jgi:hypothetical protein